jgi:hypothetical protein
MKKGMRFSLEIFLPFAKVSFDVAQNKLRRVPVLVALLLYFARRIFK